MGTFKCIMVSKKRSLFLRIPYFTNESPDSAIPEYRRQNSEFEVVGKQSKIVYPLALMSLLLLCYASHIHSIQSNQHFFGPRMSLFDNIDSRVLNDCLLFFRCL